MTDGQGAVVVGVVGVRRGDEKVPRDGLHGVQDALVRHTSVPDQGDHRSLFTTL